MHQISDWKVPKWPFLAANVVLLVFAGAMVGQAAHPISGAEILLATVSVALGAVLGCLPFILEYRATARALEVNALGSVAEKLDHLEKFTDRITAATDQWANVQEVTRGHADKTVTAASEIAERMTVEIREFNEFQARLNDNEKAALRLEVEKLHRAEGDWLQVVARILDHTYALHSAAVRSGQAEVAAQIGHFQNACRDVARRVGLTPFVAGRDEPFRSEVHRAHGVENPPADSRIEETLAPGLTFQGRLVRPALVSLQQSPTGEQAETEKTEASEAGASASVNTEPETAQAPAPSDSSPTE